MTRAEQIQKIKEKGYSNNKETGAAQTMAEFAVLLGMLADDAEKSTRRLNTYTIWLIILSVGMLIAGGAQVWFAYCSTKASSKVEALTGQSNVP